MDKAQTVYNWKGKTVLITEDIDLNYLFLEKILSQTEVNIVRAMDGYEALRLIKNNPNIDLVLMDIQMPGLDGFDTTVALKKHRPQLPVIVQTAYIIEEGRQRSAESGADEYIEKPLNVTKLFALMEKYLH
jgi:CheY-like chemotaxis protein